MELETFKTITWIVLVFDFPAAVIAWILFSLYMNWIKGLIERKVQFTAADIKPLMKRDLLQRCAYYCRRMGLDRLTMWFQTKACAAQDQIN